MKYHLYSGDTAFAQSEPDGHTIFFGTTGNLAVNPALYPDRPGMNMERDFAPLPERMKSATARQNAIPAMLAEAKKNLTDMPPVFIDVALDNLDGGISFLSGDMPKAFASVKDAALQKQFAASTKAAVDAAKDFKASDAIRDQLAALGYSVKDVAGGKVEVSLKI